MNRKLFSQKQSQARSNSMVEGAEKSKRKTTDGDNRYGKKNLKLKFGSVF